MEKVLIVATKGHFILYKAALEDYANNHENISLDFFVLDFPKVSGLAKIQYKLNIGSFRQNYYEQKRKELINLLNKYDTILFYNVFFDQEYFIQGKLKQKLKEKHTKVYFVDSIRKSNLSKDILEIFREIFVFEERDVQYIKDTFQLDAQWVTCGTSYYLFTENIAKQNEKIYDVCFVGLATTKRLEYLDVIAKWCSKNNVTLFVAGHFWHSNHKINYWLGKLKFKKKHPYLAKYVKNCFIQPYDLAGIYAKSKIVLNINISEHKGFNQRAFDIILSNSLLICDNQDVNGLEIKNGIDFVSSKNIDHMIKNISYFLNHDSERLNIINKGQRIVNQRYLYKNTLDIILNGK